MADYMKLKSYLNENKAGPSDSFSNGIDTIKQSMSGFFGRTSQDARVPAEDQMDTWFREADNDHFCPKLVNL
jgi:hypothetical protein